MVNQSKYLYPNEFKLADPFQATIAYVQRWPMKGHLISLPGARTEDGSANYCLGATSGQCPYHEAAIIHFCAVCLWLLSPYRGRA